MRKILNITFIIFSFLLFQNCEEEIEPLSIEYVSFAKPTYNTGVDVGGSATIDVVVYTANIVGTDRTFNIVVDPTSDADSGSYDVPATVTVPKGTNEGKFTVTVSDVNLGIGVNNLVIKFSGNEGFFIGAPTTLKYTQNCTEVTATLDIVFDGYPEETGWYIEDALGTTVLSKAEGAYDGLASISESIQLCAGRDYTLVVTDAYSDGMFDGTNEGSYTLIINGVVKATGGGNFGASESNDFNTN